MDTSLEDRKITLVYIIAYGVTTALIPIIVNLLYVYGGNLLDAERNLRITDEYMHQMGLVILQGVGFLSFAGTSFWIARKSRIRTLQNNFSMLIFGFITVLLFIWIMGLTLSRWYFFYVLLSWAVGTLIGSFIPRILKGKRTHHENWDVNKDEEYHRKKRK